jgi:PleD family two-component response regulator
MDSKKGKLKAYRLPGGHYRVEKQALKAFLIETTSGGSGLFRASRKRILVVDDEPSVVEIASRSLQQLGDDVTLASAADGFEAGLQCGDVSAPPAHPRPDDAPDRRL